jgi:hypothetical protein
MIAAIAAAIYVWTSGGYFVFFGVANPEVAELWRKSASLTGFVFTFILFFGFFAILPALFVIILGEIKNFRSAIYYSISAALTGFVISSIFLNLIYLFLGTLFGFLAGVTYWFVAGRHAGSWKRELT